MNRRLLQFGGLVLALGLLFWFNSNDAPVEQASVPVQITPDESAPPAREPTPTLSIAAANEDRTSPQAPQGQPADGIENEIAQTPSATQPVDTSAARTQTTGARDRSTPGDNAPRLSEQVFAVIEDVQTMQLEGRWEESLTELNALYEDYDALSSFEQTTLLNFYTNTLLRFEMWPEAIGAFSRMLVIPDLRPDLGARALMALGQLHSVVGEYGASVSCLETWQRVTSDMENMERTRERVADLLAESRAALQQTGTGVQ